MIVIVDYGLGNLGSILNMLKKVGLEATVSADPGVILGAAKLVLPGVGAFDTGMRNLEAHGLLPVLTRKVLEDRTPILGLCLGMQLMGMDSEEGSLPGLGWLRCRSVRFSTVQEDRGLRVPHMGWAGIELRREHPLFAGIGPTNRFYFVHSYYVVCDDPRDVVAASAHGVDFACAVAHDNVMGVQFHPEKSHRHGMRLLANFGDLS